VSPLGPPEFSSFFREVYDHEPYPWQLRLAKQVIESGEWPDLLDLPTGTGKTAVLDIALFALAVRGDLPRRIVFVVDRRIVVHQAARRVEQLATALDPLGSGVAPDVARRLRALAPSPPGVDEGPVLRWSELRGGIVRDESWATRPDVPAVLISTVDQVGSRLLFRGYGVSRGMRPVHAGLLGNDTLFLLDEVHLARPFRTTLRAIGSRYRGGDRPGVLPDRWRVVELSATPSEEVERRFTIHDDERRPTTTGGGPAGAELERRLAASKPAVLRAVAARPSGYAKAIADACLQEVQALLGAGTRRIGVVVNRVATAVAVERAVRVLGCETILVTGRIRPIDREEIVRRLESRVGSGRARSEDDEAVVVVATQTIEAGADLDLDALVTECASLDALQQRFGRVDRTGAISATGHPKASVVLGGSSAIELGAEDPVYGTALASTWTWLEAAATDGRIDFGFGRLPVPEGPARSELLPPQAWCPQLFPSHLDRWVQTWTQPHADPVVAHWLHGLEERPADVSVIWRADVTPDLLMSIRSEGSTDASTPSPHTVTLLGDLFEACPPDAREAMALPVRAVRRWLASRLPGGEVVAASDDVGDVTGQADLGDRRQSERLAPVVVLGTEGGPAEIRVTDRPAEIKPGDTIVVPLEYGGIHAGSWDPAETAPVVDRATTARALADRRAVLRLFAGGMAMPPVVADDGSATALAFPSPSGQDEEVDPVEVAEADRELVAEWLRTYLDAASAAPAASGAGGGGPLDLEVAVARHLASGRLHVQPIRWPGPDQAGPTGFVASTSRPLPRRALRSGWAEQTAAAVDTEPETSSFVGREVTLSTHLLDVGQWGELLARNLGLPPEVVADVALAGSLHDLGKADPRFQLMLRSGIIGSSTELLAKSGLAPGDGARRREAQRASGYPPGARHELLSLALVQGRDELARRAHDWDLVLHLVASHHGHCRPFPPVVLDGRPTVVTVEHDGLQLTASSDHGLARLDAGVPQRFWRLVSRYGWWGLAWLEAVLRLADHRASEVEQRRVDTDAEQVG
jgi:CRISPR-associated endonuclease/helicase Cas3